MDSGIDEVDYSSDIGTPDLAAALEDVQVSRESDTDAPVASGADSKEEEGSMDLSMDVLSDLGVADTVFNNPSDVVIEDWSSFRKVTSENCLRSSCIHRVELFHYVWDFIRTKERSYASWHLPANKFAQQFVVERWRKDAEKVYSNAKASGVKLPTADKKAAIALICSHIDFHMRDVGLTQRMIHDVVQQSPVLKRLRDSINAHLPSPFLTDYTTGGSFSARQRPRKSGFEHRLPEHRGAKPKDHRKPKQRQPKPSWLEY